ncbi:hypothetical protein NI17_022470 [Thermobifida halotolerans]|uniref:Uncharacterized protein n=1 Tax=Thermobifida halotolerans TaxID=483545 RepID=A0A399G0U3_9ACTN|nr:hypothetical protein [Thermobifida halotolerans]UOE19451.1 hypothetical protein NI17_022470 [Thermobifida halotolerans]
MSSNMRNTERANQLAKDAMTEAHGTCSTVYTQIDYARDFLRMNWTGHASSTYDDALILWLEELRLITNDMNNMIELFGGTERAMIAMEDENTVMGSSWLKDLNPNQAG